LGIADPVSQKSAGLQRKGASALADIEASSRLVKRMICCVLSIFFGCWLAT